MKSNFFISDSSSILKVVDITDFDTSNLSVFSRTVLKMIADYKIKPAVHKVISLQDVPEAIHNLEQRKVVGKIVVDLNKEVSAYL